MLFIVKRSADSARARGYVWKTGVILLRKCAEIGRNYTQSCAPFFPGKGAISNQCKEFVLCIQNKINETATDDPCREYCDLVRKA